MHKLVVLLTLMQVDSFSIISCCSERILPILDLQ